jgi:Protein of unknown function (DUF1569)
MTTSFGPRPSAHEYTIRFKYVTARGSLRFAVRTLARRSDEAELLARLGTVREDSARRWGRMAAHQMICHLADAFRMALGEKAASPASGLLQRTIVKAIALYAPLPWPAGRIPTRPELDQEAEGTRPGKFATDLAQVEVLVRLVIASRSTLALRPHPTFGPLSEAAWLRWAYLHTDHHLRQFGA